jgi:hypothetical protein
LGQQNIGQGNRQANDVGTVPGLQKPGHTVGIQPPRRIEIATCPRGQTLK